MDRLAIINHFVDILQAEDYLEIGVFTGYTLDGCKAKNKIGVDPNLGHYMGTVPAFPTTSDNFFSQLQEGTKFDIIFIDGLHEAPQVKQDIENALKVLKPNGVIICHDMNPPEYQHTTTGIQGCWTGDCYRAILSYRGKCPFLFHTVDTDWGVGIITRPQILFQGSEDFDITTGPIGEFDYDRALSDWEYFSSNRTELMSIISVETFKNQYHA